MLGCFIGGFQRHVISQRGCEIFSSPPLLCDKSTCPWASRMWIFILVTRFILSMVMSTIAIFIQLYKTSHFKLYQRRFHFRLCVCSSNDIQCYDVGGNNIGLSDIAGTQGKNTLLLCQRTKRIKRVP